MQPSLGSRGVPGLEARRPRWTRIASEQSGLAMFAPPICRRR